MVPVRGDRVGQHFGAPSKLIDCVESSVNGEIWLRSDVVLALPVSRTAGYTGVVTVSPPLLATAVQSLLKQPVRRAPAHSSTPVRVIHVVGMRKDFLSGPPRADVVQTEDTRRHPSWPSSN